MRTVLVLRHGKSDWEAASDDDRERPLARRGRRAAKLVGRHLEEVRQVPDRVLSSPAVRARETVQLAAAAGGWRCPVEIREELYPGSAEAAVALIAALPEGSRRTLLAGHEPACSTLIARLIGGGTLRFPTAAVARIDLAVDEWKQAEAGRGSLIWLATPKLLARP